MKIKILAYYVILILGMQPANLKAQQQFSAWSVDPGRPTLQVRYTQFKATDGNRYIVLEMTSSVKCRMQITSTLCNADPQGKNGWKNITLEKNTLKKLSFKVLNTCLNGWWWWYRSYNEIVYTY